MANRKLPLIGALIATPAMTAAFEPGPAHASASSPAAFAAPARSEAARTALKEALLSIPLGEKLAIAGARLGPDPAPAPAARLFRSAARDGSGVAQIANTDTCSVKVRAAAASKPLTVKHHRTEAKAGMCIQSTAPQHKGKAHAGSGAQLTKAGNGALTKGADQALTKAK
ncbi:MAG: hypothetical protein ACHP84_10960 [Caulobacterales bacterium]